MRGRRLRTNEVIRSMVRETVIHKEELIYPLFVVEGEGIKEEIPSMPDNYRFSIDKLMEEIKEIYELGIKGVLIFGIPDHKDELGTSAYCEGNIVAKAISEIKKYYPDMYVVADVCLCEYTNHGHCGFIENGYVNNDKTLPLLAKAAVSYAEAGADMIAPSDMMDGRISYIRKALDDAGFVNTVLMSYSAKYCSAFYGPFRDAADSAPKFGDRKTYQMDPANGREALKEILADIDEGADIIMVKPALPYLDVIKTARENVNVPVCAYNVSGEYSMIKAANKMGWLDGKKAAMESLVSIKRAGADIIITYFAKEFAKSELY
ncbi:MAG TPA: porphobilinogen synthase [Candidatus Fimicola cottocaccae]|nr:porphobilinogen synthase [Candidatus Fimicola cottocaccae]